MQENSNVITDIPKTDEQIKETLQKEMALLLEHSKGSSRCEVAAECAKAMLSIAEFLLKTNS